MVTTRSASAGTASAAENGDPTKARHAITAPMAAATISAIAVAVSTLARRAAGSGMWTGLPPASSGRTRTSEGSSIIAAYLRSEPWP
jgi:hypothetical protein